MKESRKFLSCFLFWYIPKYLLSLLQELKTKEMKRFGLNATADNRFYIDEMEMASYDLPKFKYLHISPDYAECWRVAARLALEAEVCFNQVRMIMALSADNSLHAVYTPMATIYRKNMNKGGVELHGAMFYLDREHDEFNLITLPLGTEDNALENTERKLIQIVSLAGTLKVERYDRLC